MDFISRPQIDFMIGYEPPEFFYMLPEVQDRPGNQRTWLTPPKAKRLKHVLALANPQCYSIPLLNEGGQSFAIP